MPVVTRASFVAFGLICSAAQAQSLILNGGFESPIIPSNSRQLAVPTAWTGGAFTTIINGQDVDPFAPLAIEGQQYVAIATSESLTQMFAANVAGLYTLRWFDSASHEPGLPTFIPYTVRVLSDTSEVIASNDFNAAHPEDWVERSLAMNLSPGSYTLQFMATGAALPGGASPRFDDVTLFVPEPSTATVSVGAGLLIVRWRRRRSRKTDAQPLQRLHYSRSRPSRPDW